MPYIPPAQHRSSPSSSDSSYYSSSAPSSPSSSYSFSTVSVNANQTPGRPLPISPATHHAPHTFTLLCAGAAGTRALHPDAHTEKSHVAGRASIAPPLHQSVKCQYRAVEGVPTRPPPYSNEEVCNFLEKKDKTSNDLRRLASWLLRPSCSQTSRYFDSRDQKTASHGGRPGFSMGVLDRTLGASEGGCARELSPAHSMKKSRASTANGQNTADLWKVAPRERSKSLDLVRPALRPCYHHQSASVPASPKTVHFDPILEDVRYFSQSEGPIAVSAGSSPVMDRSPCHFESPLGPYEWELSTPNFPRSAMSQKAMPVRLERVCLSKDNTALLGTVVVANLAYHKSVICRFTLDFWNTISEVSAQHCCQIQGHDVFTFNIGLTELVDLELKPMFFCIRYNVNGMEFWDNNSNLNFQVDFKKKYLW